MPAEVARASTATGRLWIELARWRPWLIGGFWILLAAGVLFAFAHAARQTSYAEVAAALGRTPATAIGLALLGTAVSYLALTGYDACGLRYVKVKLPYRLVALTSFIAYSLSNSIGLGVLTGGAVRMRCYGAAGVEPTRISLVIAFTALAFGAGTVAVGSLAMLWSVPMASQVTGLPEGAVRWVAGGTITLEVVALLALHRFRGRTLLGLRPPSLGVTAPVLLCATVDVLAAATVLWSLLPAGSVSFPVLASVYTVAIMAGVISHVPGGLGVLEAVVLTALGSQVPTHEIAAALVLNRLIYYVVPLVAGLVLLVTEELRGTPALRAAASLVPAAVSLVPRLLAVVTLLAGIMLLVRGVLPAPPLLGSGVAQRLPLAVLEFSHFLGSIAGLGLLFVARGMLQRLDAAWWAGLALSVAALALALARALPLWEAAYLGVLVASLLASHGQFRRRAALLRMPLDAGWLLAVAAIIAALTGLLLFAYRDVAYAHELWWQFEFDDHAPRAMRALVGAALATFAVALGQLLRSVPTPFPLPDDNALARARHIIEGQDTVDAGLALMGDKRLLFSRSGDAFLMFGRRGHTWAALFDPTGPREQWRELIWQFLELARESRGRPCFYQVSAKALPLYLDAGMRLIKLGEYACVPLGDFSISGRARADLRHAANRGRRTGLTVDIATPPLSAELLKEARSISDAWLGLRRAGEKGFSLGTFDAGYVQQQPLAMVRQHGVPVAFATLLITATRIEASIDLMRHLPDAPNGTMDFLLVELLTHFQAQGFQRFALGMAPLSGLSAHPLAPEWQRLGRLLFAHGERFYNFRGVRAFKDKFDPIWEPRYLAAPGGVTPWLVLADIAALVARGERPSRTA